jgi:hypothetical protein
MSWQRLQLVFDDFVSKLEVSLGDHDKCTDLTVHTSIKPNEEWLEFGVPEGDGCRRVEQFSEWLEFGVPEGDGCRRVEKFFEWLPFGVPEGDGCRRLEPTSEIDLMKPGHNIDNDVEDNNKASHTPTEIELRFALLQKIIDFLTVLKMYADIITTDYALVCFS